MIEQAIDHHNRGELDAAAKLYQQVLADDPKHVEAMHLLAMVNLSKGELEKGQQLLSEAAELSPDNDRVQKSLGELLIGRGRFEAAESHFEKAVRSNPNNADALSGLGVCRLRRQDFDAAADAFDRALLADANHPIANTQRGLMHLHQGDLDLASQHIQQALKTSPSYPPARLALAQVLNNQNAPGLALSTIEKLLEDKPNHVPAQRLAAELLLANNRLEECAAQLDRLRQKHGDDDYLLRLRGDLARANNQAAEALAYYQRGVQLAQNQTQLAERIAEMHGVLGQWQQAERLWKQFTQQQPEVPRWFIRLAEAQARQDKGDLARQTLPDPSKLDGKDRIDAAHLAAELAMRDKQMDQAIAHLEALGDSDDARITALLAALKLRSGEAAKAYTLATTATEKAQAAGQGMLSLISRRLQALSLDAQDRFEDAARLLFSSDTNADHPHLAGLEQQTQRLHGLTEIKERSAAGEVVFLCGFSGSGLETVAKALSHTDGYRVLADRLTREPRNDMLNRQNPGEAPERLDPDTIEQANRRYQRYLRRLVGTEQRVIDVLPMGRANPEILAAHFPGAQVIVVDRAPLDTVLQTAVWEANGSISAQQLLAMFNALREAHKAADGKLDLHYHWWDFDALMAQPSELQAAAAKAGLTLKQEGLSAFESGLHDDYGLPAYVPSGRAELYKSIIQGAASA
jgi:Tfp pilus assembly protein PilF